MSVTSLHPEVTTERIEEWRLMRDAFNGESAIKKRGEPYLPKPSGFNGTADPSAAYDAYKKRAQFPEILAPSVAAMIGIVHGQEIQIEIPDAMGFLWEAATNDEQPLPLEAFHRRITRHLLVQGRYGVLADAPEDGGDPYLTGFAAQTIINWDRNFFVLDETDYVRDGFAWRELPMFRVLRMEGGRYVQEIHEGTDLGEVSEVGGARLGGGALDFVPFVVANARDIVPDVETPPLIGVARAALAIYQLNADYRHQLYMSGQETLVAINGEAPEYVGAGVVHQMHGSGDAGTQPDLKYVAPSCAGIEAHKEAMQDNRAAAVMAGARMFEQSERAQESGEARRLRYAGETANLMSVALASCGLLERSLKNVALMLGLNPDEVVVTPPADLMDKTIEPEKAEALVRVWQAGAIGYDTLYENLQRGGIASAERDAEAELRSIDDAEFREPETAMAAMRQP